VILATLIVQIQNVRGKDDPKCRIVKYRANRSGWGSLDLTRASRIIYFSTPSAPRALRPSAPLG
jgi:hypothetical protein